MSDHEVEDGGGWLIDDAADDATAEPIAEEPQTPETPHDAKSDVCACATCKQLNELCDDLADVTLTEKYKTLPTTVKLEALIRLMSAISAERSIPGQEAHTGLTLVGRITHRLLIDADRKQQQMVQRVMDRIAQSGGELPITITADSLLRGGVLAGDDDGEPGES